MKSRLLLSSLLPLLIVLMFCQGVEAEIYQGCAQHSLAYPSLTLCSAIDTDYDFWTATWNGEGYIITPVPGILSSFVIVFQDGKGFYESYNSFEHGLGPRGTITIENYTHVGCWTRCWAEWCYAFPFPGGIGFLYLPLWVDLYLGHNSSRNSGGRCRDVYQCVY